ncbi:MAG: hypothetical protein AAB019_09135 [Planctomycetota bacterium]
MDCNEVKNIIEADPVEVAAEFISAYQSHLRHCPSCQTYVQEQVKFLELVQTAFDRLNPSAEVEERLLGNLKVASGQAGEVPRYKMKQKWLVPLILTAAGLLIILTGVYFFPVSNIQSPTSDFNSLPDNIITADKTKLVAAIPEPHKFESGLLVIATPSFQSELIILQTDSGKPFQSEEIMIE